MRNSLSKVMALMAGSMLLSGGMQGAGMPRIRMNGRPEKRPPTPEEVEARTPKFLQVLEEHNRIAKERRNFQEFEFGEVSIWGLNKKNAYKHLRGIMREQGLI